MKYYCAVLTYCEILDEMKVFTTLEKAREYFFSIINKNGGIKACIPEFYQDGSDGGALYWCNDELNQRIELNIWLVEVDK